MAPFQMSVAKSSLLLFLILGGVLITSVKPEPNSYELLRYMKRFGYLDVEGLEPRDASDAIQKALLELQSFSGLDKTGVLDNETAQLLARPRCGDPDPEPEFPLRGTRWLPRDGNFTWRVLRYPRACGKWSGYVDEHIERALALWTRSARLHFSRAPRGAPAHIEFVWQPPEEGAVWRAAVRAGFGALLGRVLLDEGGWGGCGDARAGPSFTAVLAHGIGHALGLPHSHDPSSVMSPWLTPPTPRLALTDEDATAVRSLYGPPRKPERLCEAPEGGLDAVISDGREALYAIAGDRVYRLNGEGVGPGNPRFLNATWPGLPAGGVDAAFELPNGVLYFFKGDLYWSYSGWRMRAGYPRNISRGFPDAPIAPDAAITWDGRIYFFKGADKWMWDEKQKKAVRADSVWPSIPASVSAAVTYRGNAFFFKGNKYYLWDHKQHKVAQGYPRSLDTDWFC